MTRIGIVSSCDPVSRTVRVYFENLGIVSTGLKVTSNFSFNEIIGQMVVCIYTDDGQGIVIGSI